MPKEIQFTSSDTEIIVNLYQGGTSCPEIGKQFNCSKQTINKLLKQNNIVVRDNSHSHQLYQVNENIFENIDSHEKAYWLGMLSGDGWVTDRNEIGLSLEITDEYLIHKYRDFLQSTHPTKLVSNGIRKDGTESFSRELRIFNKKMCDDLKQLGFTPNKTKYMSFPKIQYDFMSSYLLGLVDSDGSFCLKKIKNTERYALCFSFIAPTEFAEKFQSILIDACNISKTKLGRQKKTDFVSIVDYGGYKNIFKIVKFIYSQSPIWMQRKKDIAFKYLINKFENDLWLIQTSSTKMS